MHRELHGQPGFNGAGTQAALLPATAVCFAVLRAAGSFDLHGGSGRSVGNAVGESADRGEQASGGGGRTLARGAQIVSGGGAGAVHASGAARRPSSSGTTGVDRSRTASRNDLSSACKGSSAATGGLLTPICGFTDGVPDAPSAPTVKIKTSCRP